MSTPKYNLALNRGETFQKNIQVTDVAGVGLNLTDFTVESQIRAAYTDVSASAAFDCTVDAPLTGQFILALPATASIALTGSCYFYDIRITSGSYVRYVLEGKVHISPSVTRD